MTDQNPGTGKAAMNGGDLSLVQAKFRMMHKGQFLGTLRHDLKNAAIGIAENPGMRIGERLIRGLGQTQKSNDTIIPHKVGKDPGLVVVQKGMGWDVLPVHDTLDR
jgi:hypothetical protein